MRRANSRFTSIAIVATMAVFLACEDSPTSLDALNDSQTAPLMASDAGNPVVLSARGSGHASTPIKGSSAAPGGWRIFAFNASQKSDGSFSGQMQYDQKADLNSRNHGVVTCMNDIGEGIIIIAAHNTKRVADDLSPPNIFGLPESVYPDNIGMVFAVRDNGEGANASQPDQFTAMVFTTRAVADGVCAGAPHNGFGTDLAESFFNDVEAGNIQVSN
jgi:hypothetical protein